MNEFRSNQSAHEVHFALKSALQALEKAQQCAVLWFGEILDRRLHLELGYGSINQYAEIELGFSSTRTNDFIMLCRKLKKLPKVKEKVASGELGYTAARVLVPVTDETNEEAWLEFALNNSRRELEREVKRAKKDATDEAAGQLSLIAAPKHRPAAVVPVRVNLEMSPARFVRYEKLWEQIRKQGGAPPDKVEAVLEIMACYAAESSPRGENPATAKPPVQIHIHQCPDCAKAMVATSKGELEISETELERAQCDCQISRPGERNTTSIPPATRRKVLAHYRHKCQRPGCSHTHYLEAHHIVPRSRGGSNALKNLTCLCSACHKLIHDKTGLNRYAIPRGDDQVKSPRAIYEWRVGVAQRLR